MFMCHVILRRIQDAGVKQVMFMGMVEFPIVSKI